MIKRRRPEDVLELSPRLELCKRRPEACGKDMASVRERKKKVKAHSQQGASDNWPVQATLSCCRFDFYPRLGEDEAVFARGEEELGFNRHSVDSGNQEAPATKWMASDNCDECGRTKGRSNTKCASADRMLTWPIGSPTSLFLEVGM